MSILRLPNIVIVLMMGLRPLSVFGFPRLSMALLIPAMRPVSVCRTLTINNEGMGRTNGSTGSVAILRSSSTSTFSSSSNGGDRGTILVLGGTGFLGQNVCRKAVEAGYSVVSLSRRGMPAADNISETATRSPSIDYRQGDARKRDVIDAILNDAGINVVGVVHCIGLLFDEASGMGNLNKFVSGSGSLPDTASTYDTITRVTSFHAIDAAIEYTKQKDMRSSLPFVFTSAAEAGWPDVPGGKFMDQMAPDFLKRYLSAKRAVEAKLSASEPPLRPIIVRPSLIYSMDRPASYLPVGAFFVGNAVGLPFVDQPVTVQTLSGAIVNAIGESNVRGVLRYPDINRIG